MPGGVTSIHTPGGQAPLSTHGFFAGSPASNGCTEPPEPPSLLVVPPLVPLAPPVARAPPVDAVVEPPVAPAAPPRVPESAPPDDRFAAEAPESLEEHEKAAIATNA